MSVNGATIVLTARQERMYIHTCDIISVAQSAGSSESYILEASDIPCYFEYTQNVDDPTVLGGLKRKQFFTQDTLHLPAPRQGVTIRDGWLVRNTTINEDGGDSATFGEVSAVEGAPRITDSNFLTKQSVNLMTLEQAPSGLP